LNQFKTVAGRLNQQPCRLHVHKNFQLELVLERLLANITMVVQRANGEVTCFSFYLYALYEYRVLFLPATETPDSSFVAMTALRLSVCVHRNANSLYGIHRQRKLITG